MTALFITASGTGIGKTYLAAGLLRALRAAGQNAAAIKPVESGVAAGADATSDAGMLLAAAGRAVDAAHIASISPWRFAAPLSPDQAAAREQRSIDFDALVGFCRAELAQPGRALLIEGVGGVMVPLDATHTTLDWMAALGIPVLLVSGSALGSISHCLTAAAVLGARGLAPWAIVVSETAGSTVDLHETVAAIARFAAPALVLALPRADPAAAKAVLDQLGAGIGGGSASAVRASADIVSKPRHNPSSSA